MWTKTRQLAACAFCATVTSLPVSAAVTQYNSLAAFLAAVQAAEGDSFNDLAYPDQLVTSPSARSLPSYGYSASATGGLFSVGPSAADRWLSVTTKTAPLLLSSFTGTPSAIGGFFGATDFDGNFAAGSVTVEIDDDLSTPASFALTPQSGLAFMGFVSTGNITSLSVVAANPAGTPERFAAINDLYLARACVPGQTCPDPNPVPAPATVVLTGLALAGLAATRRRRANAA